MTFPDTWPAVILALGVFRLTRLVGWDDLTIPPRRWVTGMGDEEHHSWAKFVNEIQQSGNDPWDEPQPYDGVPPPVSRRRFYLSKLLRCPWCVGFWLSAATWVLWLNEPQAVVALTFPFALSAAVGLVAKNLDP